MRFHTILRMSRSDIITTDPETNPNCLVLLYRYLDGSCDGNKKQLKKKPNCQPNISKIQNIELGYPGRIFFSTNVNRFSSGIQVSFPIAIRQHTTYPNSDHRKKRYMMLSSVTYSSVKYDERYCISHSPPASYMSKKWINENRFLRFPCWGFIPPLSTRNNTNQQNQTSNRVRQTKQQQTNNKQLE